MTWQSLVYSSSSLQEQWIWLRAQRPSVHRGGSKTHLKDTFSLWSHDRSSSSPVPTSTTIPVLSQQTNRRLRHTLSQQRSALINTATHLQICLQERWNELKRGRERQKQRQRAKTRFTKTNREAGGWSGAKNKDKRLIMHDLSLNTELFKPIKTESSCDYFHGDPVKLQGKKKGEQFN